ncbi:putative transcriptional regulator LysR-type [Paraburkholderia piptadeniae]|uniref:Transcriptional regulator LysR-type n=1 Tax=Paraburkholderia piptadeniae TaxID=1701573 RepID=A0A1N7RJP4_9BURK|nr:LysR family transcriptional regulator [Paraburkholderia piptadeniae]SIT34917.1 putative transcriptional regulator LysR-type [Paraburkholderia piptadeniae]
MDTVRTMRIFARVAEAGSFTVAAQSMDLTAGVVSRAVSELEDRIRTRLLHRSTRSLALTDAGERYLKRVVGILAEVDSAEDEASGANNRPEGALKVFSCIGLAGHMVLPAILKYREANPDVTVELTASQNVPDLFDGHSDVAIVAAQTLPDSGLVSRLLGTSFSVLCAAPAYLGEHGLPRCPEDLSGHNCLALHSALYPGHEWTLEGAGRKVVFPVRSAIQTNTAETLAVAIKSGAGIGALPLYAAIDDIRAGKIIRVLPEYTVQSINIYALYASRKFTDAKIKTWVEFLRTELPHALAAERKLLLDCERSAAFATKIAGTSVLLDAGTRSLVV